MGNKLKLFIYDGTTLITDPHGEIADVDIESFRTAWPGGFVDARQSISRPIMRSWGVKLNQRLVLRNGFKTVFEGTIEDLAETQGADGKQAIALPALGYVARLNSRKENKRWADTRLSEWVWPNGFTAQQDQFSIDWQNRLQFQAKDGVVVANNEYGALRYVMPAGEEIKRVTCSYDNAMGAQTWTLGLYDVLGAAYLVSTAATASGSWDHTLVTPRRYLEFRWQNTSGGNQTGLEDGTVYGNLTSIVVYSETGNIYADEIAKDLLAQVSELSTDYGDIASPALALVPFLTPNWETMESIIRRACDYGDASANTWGLCIWDSSGSSDGLPQATLEARSISGYEYLVSLSDLDSFSSDPSLDQTYNYIIVEFKDEEGKPVWLTPVGTASLTDSDSVSDYGQRDYVLRVDTESATTAQYLGERFLARHKDPVYKTSFTITGQIPNATGVLQPACRVRAGERVRVTDYLDGQTYFIAFTEYNAQTEQLTIHADMPPDDVGTLLAQLALGR